MTKSRGIHSPHVLGDAHARFWAKVDVRGPDECWPWKAGKYPSGYGQFAVDVYNRRQAAHIFAWEEANGPVPPGMTLDHECHNADPVCRLGAACPHRACCNPAHVTPKTRRANVLAGKTLPAANAVKTHCGRGHEFTGSNTYRWNGKRLCRMCRAMHAANRRGDASSGIW